MGYAYKINDQQVKDWIDIFTRNEYREIITDSLSHCIDKKGLEIYSWVLMTNHLHLIASSSKEELSGILRDFKNILPQKL